MRYNDLHLMEQDVRNLPRFDFSLDKWHKYRIL